MSVPSDADWLGKLYQSANRYAFLYFLREVCGVEVYLVNVYFVNDPHSPTTLAQWEEGLIEVDRQIGFNRKPQFSASIFLDALP